VVTSSERAINTGSRKKIAFWDKIADYARKRYDGSLIGSYRFLIEQVSDSTVSEGPILRGFPNVCRMLVPIDHQRPNSKRWPIYWTAMFIGVSRAPIQGGGVQRCQIFETLRPIVWCRTTKFDKVINVRGHASRGPATLPSSKSGVPTPDIFEDPISTSIPFDLQRRNSACYVYGLLGRPCPGHQRLKYLRIKSLATPLLTDIWHDMTERNQWSLTFTVGEG